MIRVQGLSKSFRQTPILTDLTFHLGEGDRLALLGVNGSGKTLLLNLIATLIKPTTGSIEIAGYDAATNMSAVRPLIGYVPQVFEGYGDLSVQEYLEFFAGAYNLERARRAVAIREVLDLMELARCQGRKIEELSLGQKRRVCLAKTFLHEPQIWLLDDPLSALDAQGQLEMNALVQELGAMGKTVILATNHPAQITTAYSHVGILSEGKMAFYGRLEDLPRHRTGMSRLEIEVASGIDLAQRMLNERSDSLSVEATDRQLQIEGKMSDVLIASLLKDLIHAGVLVVGVRKIEAGVADLFFDLATPDT